jgi:hypothetical protein
MICNLANRLFFPILESVSLTLVIFLGGCSGSSVSNTTPATIRPLSTQFSQTDLAFIAEIEAYARNNGTTFSDVTPAQNVNNAHTICNGVQTNGASAALKAYFNSLSSENPNLTEGEQSALGYFFSTSVRYYCPQYLEDVRNFLANQGALTGNE